MIEVSNVVSAGTRAAMSTSTPPAVETSDVTIVVATRNRPEQLARTVARHRAPVVVVDNASDEPVRVPGATVIRLAENRGAAARNSGAQRAGTPYVAFADDDSYWEPGALARAVQIFEAHPRAVLLAARVRVGPGAREDPVSQAMAAAPLGTPPGAAGPAVLGFLACAIVVRRDAFLAAGGFEPRFLIMGEEELLAMDLAARGGELSYVAELVVRHLPETAGRDPLGRRRLAARNRVLTALLRRPAGVAGRVAVREISRDVALFPDIVRHLGWALRNRRRLPADVEAAVRRLATT